MLIYHYFKPGEGILACLEADLKEVAPTAPSKFEGSMERLIRVGDEPPFMVLDIVMMQVDEDGVGTGQIVDESDPHWVEEIKETIKG